MISYVSLRTMILEFLNRDHDGLHMLVQKCVQLNDPDLSMIGDDVEGVPLAITWPAFQPSPLQSSIHSSSRFQAHDPYTHPFHYTRESWSCI